MSIEVTGKTDKSLENVRDVLQEYAEAHPHAEIRIYRKNCVSIRIRIIDPDFKGMSKSDRHNQVWQLVEKMPEDTQKDISVLLLLAPDETKGSLMNLEFEDPSPSLL